MICRKCSGLSERSLVAEQILGLLPGIHPARQPRAKEAAEGNARCTVRLLVAADPNRAFHPPWDADGTWPFTVRRCSRRRGSSLRDTIPREIVVRCQQLVTGTANLLLWSQQLIIERKRKSRSRDVNGLNFTLGNELGLPDARYRFVRTPSLCEYQRQQADVKLPSVSTRAPGEVVAPIGAGEEVPGGNEVGNWSSRPDRRPFPPWPAAA